MDCKKGDINKATRLLRQQQQCQQNDFSSFRVRNSNNNNNNNNSDDQDHDDDDDNDDNHVGDKEDDDDHADDEDDDDDDGDDDTHAPSANAVDQAASDKWLTPEVWKYLARLYWRLHLKALEDQQKAYGFQKYDYNAAYLTCLETAVYGDSLPDIEKNALLACSVEWQVDFEVVRRRFSEVVMRIRAQWWIDYRRKDLGSISPATFADTVWEDGLVNTDVGGRTAIIEKLLPGAESRSTNKAIQSLALNVEKMLTGAESRSTKKAIQSLALNLDRLVRNIQLKQSVPQKQKGGGKQSTAGGVSKTTEGSTNYGSSGGRSSNTNSGGGKKGSTSCSAKSATDASSAKRQ
jgi:hypothetical protein